MIDSIHTTAGMNLYRVKYNRPKSVATKIDGPKQITCFFHHFCTASCCCFSCQWLPRLLVVGSFLTIFEFDVMLYFVLLSLPPRWILRNSRFLFCTSSTCSRHVWWQTQPTKVNQTSASRPMILIDASHLQGQYRHNDPNRCWRHAWEGDLDTLATGVWLKSCKHDRLSFSIVLMLSKHRKGKLWKSSEGRTSSTSWPLLYSDPGFRIIGFHESLFP